MANRNEYIANLGREIASLKRKLRTRRGETAHIRERGFDEPWRNAAREHTEMLMRCRTSQPHAELPPMRRGS